MTTMDSGISCCPAAAAKRKDERPVQVVRLPQDEKDEAGRRETTRRLRDEPAGEKDQRRGRLHDDPTERRVDLRAPSFAKVPAVGRAHELQRDEREGREGREAPEDEPVQVDLVCT